MRVSVTSPASFISESNLSGTLSSWRNLTALQQMYESSSSVLSRWFSFLSLVVSCDRIILWVTFQNGIGHRYSSCEATRACSSLYSLHPCACSEICRSTCSTEPCLNGGSSLRLRLCRSQEGSSVLKTFSRIDQSDIESNKLTGSLPTWQNFTHLKTM